MELFKKYRIAIACAVVAIICVVCGVVVYMQAKAADAPEAVGMTYSSDEAGYTAHDSSFAAETTKSEPDIALLHFETGTGDEDAQWVFGDVEDATMLALGGRSVDQSSELFDGKYDTQLCIVANKAGETTFKAYGPVTETITVHASEDSDGNVVIDGVTKAVDVKE